MSTIVVNRHHQPYDVYIGRPSKWGNPFTREPGNKNPLDVQRRLKQIEDGCIFVATREEAILRYAKWIKTRPELLTALPELAGKRLGCWCKPRGCHGDVLVALLRERGLHG